MSRKIVGAKGKTLATYSLVLGTLYAVVGSIELTTGLYHLVTLVEAPILGLPIDLYGGFATLVIGVVYFGATPLWKGKYESLGFVMVGALMSAVFGVLYLILMGANGLGAVLEGALAEWDWMSELIIPEIWLFFLSVPLGISALRATKAK